MLIKKCEVKQKGKYFIVIDHANNKSYPMNNKINAEQLCDTLNGWMDKYVATRDLLKQAQDTLNVLQKELADIRRRLEGIIK